MNSWIEPARRRIAAVALCVFAVHAAALYAALPRPRGAGGAQPASRVAAVHVVSVGMHAGAPESPPQVPAPGGELPVPPPPTRAEALDAGDQAILSSLFATLDGEAYVARDWLDVPPVVLDAVLVPFPAVEGLVDLTLEVGLFIDEAGAVRRVDVETPRVAEPFVRAVTQAFSGARFTPGQIGGVPVRSRIRVQVEFRA